MEQDIEIIKCYLAETRRLCSEIKKNTAAPRKILNFIRMTKDNSRMLSFMPIFNLLKALEGVYTAAVDERVLLRLNVEILIGEVADEVCRICHLIEIKSPELEELDVRPYIMFCDKAVVGEIFDAERLVGIKSSDKNLQAQEDEKQKNEESDSKIVDSVIKISSAEVAKIVNMHEEMIARTYIISNQISILKTSLAENDMRAVREAYKLISNDSQTLQNSIMMSHENFMSLVQDDEFLKNHQEYQGFFVTANDEKYLIPSEYIFDVICQSPLNYETKQNQKIVRYVIESESGFDEDAEEEEIPVYSLSSLFPGQKTKSLNVMDTILIVDYQSQRIGIIVDSVQKFVSLIKKNLPPAFKNFVPLQGLAFDEKYDMVPILHVPEIMRRFRALRGYDVKRFEALTKKHINRILIVDDSDTTRQITRTILMANNFIVDEAVDGIDAIEKIKQKQFDLVLCDDDMPRMNGEILLDNIRRMENYSEVPVVAMADSNIEKADAFVSKAEFKRDILIGTVKKLLGE